MALADGTTVVVHYTGTLDDGTQFDSSRGREPLSVTLGQGMVIPGFEKALRSMNAVGDTCTTTIPYAEAYGPHHEEMVLTVPRQSFPSHIPAQVGEQIILRSPEGHEIPAAIVEVSEESVTIDANHPLAGQDLTFEIEVVRIDA
ncbi:peptidyl-prolyl cis-trans isomerase [Thermodesulfomicrobium sp. WS]|uniref:FKBP-type peptidyl-prolyl cis-trans isomerase n=1 Tax=Thermodesulfomicrobium sp. WS TaxID=3004129 RepID=UPI0024923C01|nr:peptidylprolyl isomerase [Thermodesulfomicrobium sp. WS]BDV00601.1 peptidyl-prolyl cis-trans isomerase [Thermodesulfomicrobium sp. WS]